MSRLVLRQYAAYVNQKGKNMMQKFRCNLIGIVILVVGNGVWAQTDIAPSREDMPEPRKTYSPYVERAQKGSTFAEGVYWGDTHLHTG